jgi:hypothetical protein
MKDSGKMWIAFSLVAAFFLVIIYFNPILYKTPWAIWRFIELSLILAVSNFVSRVDYHGVLSVAYERILSGSWSTINTEMMSVVDNILVNEYSGYAYSLLLIVFFVIKFTREEYRKSLNFDELLEQLSRHFRFARCMIHLDPTKGVKALDMTQGPFRLKEEVVPFLKKHNAIGSFQMTPVSEESFYLKKNVSDETLLKTLGRKFEGIDNLNYYERWLFAVFCVYIKSKKYGDALCREGDLILGDISYYINGEGNLRRANALTNKIIKQYMKDDQIQKVCKSHYYISGVLKSLFRLAKSRGVHPSFHFQWLYTIDRTLMLVLDETGMPDERGSVLEVASPESGIECYYPRLHWTNEMIAKTKLYEPTCSYIITTFLEDYLVRVYNFVPEVEALAIIAMQAEKAKKREEAQAANSASSAAA